MEIALKNNKVIRNIGGSVQGPPDFITRNPEAVADDLRSGHRREQPRGGVEVRWRTSTRSSTPA